MKDFLLFKKMITPVFIQVAFWIGVVACLISGIVLLRENPMGGILIILLGPIGVRIYCEIIILAFSINDTLTEIKNRVCEKGE
ncbi:MAG: DUF4282 domain-containing protein [Planctomycetota bacterium]